MAENFEDVVKKLGSTVKKPSDAKAPAVLTVQMVDRKGKIIDGEGGASGKKGASGAEEKRESIKREQKTNTLLQGILKAVSGQVADKGKGGIFGGLSLTKMAAMSAIGGFMGTAGGLAAFAAAKALFIKGLVGAGIGMLVMTAVWSTVSSIADGMDAWNKEQKKGGTTANKVAAFIGHFLGGQGGGLWNALIKGFHFASAGMLLGLTIGGPPGMIVGALLGAVVGGISGYFGGEKIKKWINDIADGIPWPWKVTLPVVDPKVIKKRKEEIAAAEKRIKEAEAKKKELIKRQNKAEEKIKRLEKILAESIEAGISGEESLAMKKKLKEENRIKNQIAGLIAAEATAIKGDKAKIKRLEKLQKQDNRLQASKRKIDKISSEIEALVKTENILEQERMQKGLEITRAKSKQSKAFKALEAGKEEHLSPLEIAQLEKEYKSQIAKTKEAAISEQLLREGIKSIKLEVNELKKTRAAAISVATSPDVLFGRGAKSAVEESFNVMDEAIREMDKEIREINLISPQNKAKRMFEQLDIGSAASNAALKRRREAKEMKAKAREKAREAAAWIEETRLIADAAWFRGLRDSLKKRKLDADWIGGVMDILNDRSASLSLQEENRLDMKKQNNTKLDSKAVDLQRMMYARDVTAAIIQAALARQAAMNYGGGGTTSINTGGNVVNSASTNYVNNGTAARRPILMTA